MLLYSLTPYPTPHLLQLTSMTVRVCLTKEKKGDAQVLEMLMFWIVDVDTKLLGWIGHVDPKLLSYWKTKIVKKKAKKSPTFKIRIHHNQN